MTELDDQELLAQYVRTGSGTAFAALVERYVNCADADVGRDNKENRPLFP